MSPKGTGTFGDIGATRTSRWSEDGVARPVARMVVRGGTYPRMAARSFSGVLMGRTSNSRTSTSSTPGDTNAGSVGPR